MSIVVTGASGQLGHRVAELLLDQVDPAQVVLVTRRPEALADLAARGASVRKGDFDHPDSLREAFAGAERLLLISTDAVGARAHQHAEAIDAAKAAGVRLIAYTSVPNPTTDNPAAVADDHRRTEELILASGIPYVFLRNALYSEMQVGAAQGALASGQLVTNEGDSRTAYVTREDCAAVAAAVLAGGDHAGQAYDVTGELLSAADRAAIFAEVGGRPVEVVAVDDDALQAGLEAAGLPHGLPHVLTSFGAASRQGFLDVESDVVERLTGRPPQRLRDVLEAQRAALVAA
ncbi:NmrA-like protein [Patulibacter medicamentivorans]|jgi:NAD(P)H dehydrogenase (quinone)|uniref:NmrA-like protein n=1 Tax=Patulibacter medicamentivorans TaxID=1097667 RepID=H0E8Y4_9ACTN|nr:NAD(P)H-binding protein [Patulibacter medicamentivorans]EHN09884.1 NmrA-like protein [Patulibacter medicamentivorans]